jgi:hypothetical protein
MDISRVAEQLLDLQEGKMPPGKPIIIYEYVISISTL